MRNIDPAIQRLVPVRTPIAILGVPIDNVTAAETVERIEQMVASRQPHYLVTANVDFLVRAQTDVELQRVLADADLVLCDGTPLVWASRLLGNPLPERVAGSDLAPVLLKVAAEKGYRVFFLGATPDSLDEAVLRVTRDHPSLMLAGSYSPPFDDLLRMDHAEIKRRVREAQPDILFVAFGCPKAEKWMAMHYRDLAVPVVVGVGATIDFLAGRVKRAPVWMRQAGLEWLFRAACEPRRLARRYIKDLWVFAWKIAVQMSMLQLLPLLSRRKRGTTPGRWWDSTRAVGRHCIVDLSGLPSIDSSDVGLVLTLRKKLHAAGRHFVLASVRPRVRRALAVMGLQNHIAVAENILDAERIIQSRTDEQSAAVTGHLPGGARELAWRGEITAANASQVWNHTRVLLEGAARPGHVAVDLTQARFIDSCGLAMMVRLQQWAWRQGTQLVFTGASPAVRNVLRMATLDQLLLEKPELTGLMALAVSVP